MVIQLFLIIFCGFSTLCTGADADPNADGKPNMSMEEFTHLLNSGHDLTPMIRLLAFNTDQKDTNGNTVPTPFHGTVKSIEKMLTTLARKQNDETLDDDDLETLAANRQAFHSAIANAELRQGSGENTGAKQARELMDVDKHDQPVTDFIADHKGKLGLGVYLAGDGWLQQYEANNLAEALEAKTACDVADGSKDMAQSFDGVNSLQSIMRWARPLTKTTYGIMPFADTLSKQKYISKYVLNNNVVTPPQHTANKVLGGANLTMLAASLLCDIGTAHNTKLTARESYLLSYLNRRYGVPSDITEYKQSIKRLAKSRFLTQMLGLYAAPVLLSLLMPNMSRKEAVAFSPAMAVANTASVLDSLMSIWQRHKTQALIKKIKKITPYIERELVRTPPTEAEKKEDRLGASFAAEEL